MYIIYAPEHPTIEPRFNHSLQLAQAEQQTINSIVGKDCAVIEVIQTVRLQPQNKDERL